ncbi:hypothetical protein D3C76_102600 [compost metagenome]
MGIPVVFTQEEIDQMANKPFDVYDKYIRKNMDEHQVRLNAIAERDAARAASMNKWKRNDPA